MSRILIGVALWAIMGLAQTPAVLAQIGVGEVLATQAAGQELQGNRARAAAEAQDQAEAATADADNPEGSDSKKLANAAPPPAKPPAFDKWNDEHSIPRAKSPSISWLKMLPVGLMLLIWIRVGDWVNQDVNEFELGYQTWSLVALLPGIIGGVLLLLLPIYAAGVSLLAVCCVGPMIAYAVHHNRSVEQHQRVFTPDWWRYAIAGLLSKVGVKVKTEKAASYTAGAPVDLIAAGDDERARQANLLTARQSPGYVLVKDLIAEMVDRGSIRVLLDYSQQGVKVRHLIDGVWHSGQSQELDAGNVMLAVMKQLANLNAKDRRSKQQGEFAAEFKHVKYQCPLQTQGVKTGERVVLTLKASNEKKFGTYDDIGMRSKMAEEWSSVLASASGLIVISALPENGLTTLTNVSLHETDRLMRDFIAIEDEARPEIEMENIEQVFYNRAAGETPATLMPKLIRKYPDVYVARDFVDADSAKLLLEQAVEGKLIITTTQARDASEALAVLAQRAPANEVAKTLIGSANGKLIRLLCTECRVGFEPSPELLKKLGIPAGKVEMLYREPTAEEAPKPCKACGGIGYRGRTSLFEVLLPDDRVREVLIKKPKPDLLRKASRAAGMRSFQEEGILLVAKGATSLAELQRVLKS